MRLLDGELVLSASDLTGFAACGHLTNLDLAVARDERQRPERRDPLVDVLARHGDEHERALLAEMRAGGTDVVEIAPETTTRAGLEAAATETVDAMRAGAPVIFQATFFHDGWVGHADFVERVEEPSGLGAWSYEVADAKLARTAKAGAVLQLCSYSEHVARLQGRPPEHLHVLTGDGGRTTLRVADYAAYFRSVKARLAAALAEPVDTFPEPVEHCGVCRWSDVCAERRRDEDHLSLVAGMRRDQAARLVGAGIATRRDFAALDEAPTIAGIGSPTLARLHHQARLQVAGEGATTPHHELLEPTPPGEHGQQLGFVALPAPSPGDLFLDLEGHPFARDGGLEYLFGVVEVIDATPRFTAFWAHDRAEERRAFEALVDLVCDRRARHPDLHVYHYAPYETTALRRLMGLHATCEEAIDDLLRGEVFVDLHRVVRHAVRLSTESYSLKEVERLYMDRGDAALTDAAMSIVAYEDYLETGDSAHLDQIKAYNRADCESLLGLRDWLEDRRRVAEERWGPIPRPRAPEAAVGEDRVERDARAATLAGQLLDGVADDREQREDDEQARWVLAHLLGWHRREAKPTWWTYFQRVDTYDDDDFVEDTESIGGLVAEGEAGRVKQSIDHRYRFEPQDHKISVGATPMDPATGKRAGTVIDVGDDTIVLRRGTRTPAPHPRAIFPHKLPRTDVLEDAIADVARHVTDHGLDGPGPWAAARDLLTRRTPRVDGIEPGAPIVTAGVAPAEVATGIATRLDETCLPIQGPPGAGKTYTGAHMIVAALEAGMRVGVTASSHTAITNLLDAVCTTADDRELEVRGIQKTGGDERRACDDDRIIKTSENPPVAEALRAGEATLAAGTAWLWARPEMRGALDVLFVDEAAQMSLADVVAVSTAASSLVLLGDPQQLAQPSRGSHPDGVGVSALTHLLGHHDTMPPERGLFLDATYRMHPAVTSFVSEIVYEGRLGAAPGRERQRAHGEAGLRFVPVEHAGNRVRATEEAEVVADLVDEMVGAPWFDHDGVEHRMGLDDLIVTAPYNAQVAELRGRLPEGAHVGTVDMFQGREGVVAIYSMASSSVEDAPRGMGFLYDLHRLNVAVSRARAVAIIVASPALLRVLCRTPEQMRLANALCRFVEMAR